MPYFLSNKLQTGLNGLIKPIENHFQKFNNKLTHCRLMRRKLSKQTNDDLFRFQGFYRIYNGGFDALKAYGQ
jgi:hypothetical protein